MGSKKRERPPSSFASYLDNETSHKDVPNVGADKGSGGSARGPSSPPFATHFDNFTDAVVEAAAKASNGSGENRFR